MKGAAMSRRAPERRRPGPDLDDETDLTEPARHELVAQAALIFGEEAARELAGHPGVPFEACQLEPSA
ncbi:MULTISPECIES: hypothetical protein [unclassified Methylobacterium]|uniref:hypothetical protein n=1 Tax=unclassified Methylobacterium TaxID=2615210 RepID=UPI001114C7F1|nr:MULTISPECIES: hypothetical protein [unclassified Methylobacterium]